MNLLFPSSNTGVKGEALKIAGDTAAEGLWTENRWEFTFKIAAWVEQNRHTTGAQSTGKPTAGHTEMIQWYDQAIATNAMLTWTDMTDLSKEIVQRAVDAGLEVARQVPTDMARPRQPQPAPGPRPEPGAGRGSGAGSSSKKRVRKARADDGKGGWSKRRASGNGVGRRKPPTRAHPGSTCPGEHAAVALLEHTCHTRVYQLSD